jgi:hypothetical protein
MSVGSAGVLSIREVYQALEPQGRPQKRAVQEAQPPPPAQTRGNNTELEAVDRQAVNQLAGSFIRRRSLWSMRGEVV